MCVCCVVCVYVLVRVASSARSLVCWVGGSPGEGVGWAGERRVFLLGRVVVVVFGERGGVEGVGGCG